MIPQCKKKKLCSFSSAVAKIQFDQSAITLRLFSIQNISPWPLYECCTELVQLWSCHLSVPELADDFWAPCHLPSPWLSSYIYALCASFGSPWVFNFLGTTNLWEAFLLYLPSGEVSNEGLARNPHDSSSTLCKSCIKDVWKVWFTFSLYTHPNCSPVRFRYLKLFNQNSPNKIHPKT